jgi:uncharacterized protein
VPFLKGPLIKKFCTEKSSYIYDVNTNEIVSVDSVLYDVVDFYGLYSGQDLRSRFSGVYTADLLKEAKRKLALAKKEEGLFSTHRPSSLDYYKNMEAVEGMLAHGMQQLILEVTDRCNLRCRYCIYSVHYPHTRVHGTRTMPLETALKAIELFMAHNQDTAEPALTFYGGEPLLALPLLKKIVDYLKRNYTRNVRMNLTTNGTLLFEEAARFLKENDIAIVVSLDGPKDIHDSMRVYANGTGTFEVILHNLRNLKKNYPEYYDEKVGIRTTLACVDAAETIRDFFISDTILFKDKMILTGFVDTVDTDLFTRNIVDINDKGAIARLSAVFHEAILKQVPIDPFLDSLFMRSLKKIHKRIMEPLGETHYPNGICCPGARRTFCTLGGSLSVCERVSAGLCIGHVDTGIDPQRVCDILQEYIKLSNPQCVDCWAVRFCSLCFTSIYNDRFDIERKNKICEMVRANIKADLVLYCTVMESNENAFESLL